MTTSQTHYETSDLSLCTALCCHGYQVESIDKSTPHKAVFFIKRDENLDKHIQAYFTHQMKVDPSAFFYQLKEIKTRLYHH